MTYTATDAIHIAHALRLAERGLYTTDPNPRVGCVLVRDGQVVGEGWHRKAGEPHAERIALAAAGDRARGATAYVTLEPCSHFGRTPPCADGLVEAGVARVVAAMGDPNPLVAGNGFAKLRDAGIAVVADVAVASARALNPGFIRRMESGMPYVRCKLAMSLDGRTAMSSGESKWITGTAARRDVQLLRARSSVVLTGSGTVLADNPSLNVRLDERDLFGVEDPAYLRQPLRAVLDTRLRMPVNARMLRLPGSTLVFTGMPMLTQAAGLRAAGAEVVGLPAHGDHLDLRAALVELARRGGNEVLIEAGATLAGAALQAGLVDELIVYMAPHLMGDAARGLVKLPGLERMDQRIGLRLTDARQVGEDLRLTLHPHSH